MDSERGERALEVAARWARRNLKNILQNTISVATEEIRQLWSRGEHLFLENFFLRGVVSRRAVSWRAPSGSFFGVWSRGGGGMGLRIQALRELFVPDRLGSSWFISV